MGLFAQFFTFRFNSTFLSIFINSIKNRKTNIYLTFISIGFSVICRIFFRAWKWKDSKMHTVWKDVILLIGLFEDRPPVRAFWHVYINSSVRLWRKNLSRENLLNPTYDWLEERTWDVLDFGEGAPDFGSSKLEPLGNGRGWDWRGFCSMGFSDFKSFFVYGIFFGGVTDGGWFLVNCPLAPAGNGGCLRPVGPDVCPDFWFSLFGWLAAPGCLGSFLCLVFGPVGGPRCPLGPECEPIWALFWLLWWGWLFRLREFCTFGWLFWTFWTFFGLGWFGLLGSLASTKSVWIEFVRRRPSSWSVLEFGRSDWLTSVKICKLDID